MSWTFKNTNRTSECDLLSVLGAATIDLGSPCFQENIKFDFKRRVLYSQPEYSPFSFAPIDTYSSKPKTSLLFKNHLLFFISKVVNAIFEGKNNKGNFLFSWSQANKKLDLVKSGCINQTCLDYVKSLKSSYIVQLFNESDIRSKFELFIYHLYI